MVRLFMRVSGVLGLTALVLVIAASALAMPANRSGGAQPIGTGSQPQLAAITPDFSVTLSQVVPSGLSSPVGIANAGDGSGRLFVVEQAGYIRIIKNGVLLNTPYLNLTGKVICCGERGLLSVAFDPSYKTNGIFYVYYTAANTGAVTIERYIATNPASDVAAIASSTVILSVAHPAVNHNGGQLQFGPDGYLYTGLGDGGGGGDQHGTIGNGQDPAVLLGKILRLNVHGVPTYTIPASNPFAQTAGYRPEIWALGLRNPWRFSFDRGTGDLYIGDVGQDCFEEIDYQPVSSHGGENYGWRVMEGFHQFDPANMTNCNQPIVPPGVLITLTRPITDYYHGPNDVIGDAVSGGYVYRGAQYSWMRGVYFYGDSGSGRIWAIEQISPGVWVGAEKLDSPYGITSFGEDESGELYVTNYGNPNVPGSGGIYKITSPVPANFSASSKSVSAARVKAGTMVTYTIVVRNTGALLSDTVRVTDTLPAGLSYVAGSLTATSGTRDDSAAPTLKWHGVVSTTPVVTLTFVASVTAPGRTAIVNTAIIDPGSGSPLTRAATIIVNPYDSFLPRIYRNY